MKRKGLLGGGWRSLRKKEGERGRGNEIKSFGSDMFLVDFFGRTSFFFRFDP